MILVLKQKNIIFDGRFERGLGSLVTDRKLRIFFYASQLTELTLFCLYFFSFTNRMFTVLWQTLFL